MLKVFVQKFAMNNEILLLYIHIKFFSWNIWYSCGKEEERHNGWDTFTL